MFCPERQRSPQGRLAALLLLASAAGTSALLGSAHPATGRAQGQAEGDRAVEWARSFHIAQRATYADEGIRSVDRVVAVRRWAA